MKNEPQRSTRFQPGVSGNKAGRPPGRGLTDRLRAALREKDADGVTAGERIVQAVVDAALAGDYRFVQMIFDRMDGKVTDKLEASGEVKVTLVYCDESPQPYDYDNDN